MPAQSMNAAQWALLFILSLLWGGSFIGAEVALAELPPLSVVFARVALAALALQVVVRLRGLAMPRGLRGWAPYAVMGLFNNAVPFSLIVWGQTHLTGGLAAILNATTPLFTVLLAHLLGAEALTRARLVGIALGIAGVVVLVGAPALAPTGVELLAHLAILGAAVSYACASLWGRRFSGRPVLITAAAQVSCSSVMMLPLVLLVDRPWTLPLPGAATWVALLVLGLACTALAYLLYFRLLATAGATNLMLVTVLIPPSAVLLGAALLEETVSAPQLAGMACIGLGLLVLDGRPWARLRRWTAAARGA